MRSACLILLLSAACHTGTSSGTTLPPRTAAQANGEWKCYVVDPKEPSLPQGNVTHQKQRLVDGRLEFQSVHVQFGKAGATRLVFSPVGDHLETVYRGVTMIAKLRGDARDPMHWTLHYADPMNGLEFSEESVSDRVGLTVISIDRHGDAIARSNVRFLSAPCTQVDAELAKYPE
jgi:hypothetical protein